MSASLSIRLTPQHHLVLEASEEEPAPPAEVAARVAQAFAKSTAAGVLHLGAAELESVVPPSLKLWREVGQAFMGAVCAIPDLESARKSVKVPADVERLAAIRDAAPPTPGGEYLDAAALAETWAALETELRAQLAAFSGSAEAYLRGLAPSWNTLGRVYLHLAENKADEMHPFAFLATYTAGLSPKERVQHTPLGEALRAYASARDRPMLQRLLEPVRRAAEKSPLIRELLQSDQIFHPLAWTPPQAHRFLQEVPALEGTGLLVRVPDWWKARPRPVVQISVGAKPPSTLGLDALLDFSMGLAIDGKPLTAAEQRALLSATEALVLLKGKWVEVDRAKIQQALDHWKGVEQAARKDGLTFTEGMRLLAGVRLGAEETGPSTTLAWSDVVAGPWMQEMLDQLGHSDSRQRLKAGPDLKATLRPYQEDGVAWLGLLHRLRLGACLADDMGLGKTVQVIALWLALRTPATTGAHLLVAPASLLANWKSELARFGPSLRVSIAHPSELSAAELTSFPAKVLPTSDVVLTTYGQLHRLPWVSSVAWNTAVLDEAQNLKNPSAKQTRAAKTLKARMRVALTGTPVENRLGDLWSLFDFLNPGLLGSAKQFGTLTKSMAKAGPNAYAPLRKLVKPYLLRRLKTDPTIVPDLPAKTELKAYCSLTHAQAVLYEDSVKELKAKLEATDKMERRGAVLAFLMRFKQICNHPAQWLGTKDYDPAQSGKMARLRELAEEIASRQEKVLVFTQFQAMVAPLATFLASVFGREGVTLDGSTSLKDRQARVKRFQDDETVPFFVLSVKAGGTGLNLTAASQVIHFDRWWNPAVENQATDRAFRLGQKRNVLVHKFVCRGTVEERIDELIESKRTLADSIVEGGGELLLTEMSNDALLKLVSLDLKRASEDA